MIEITFVLISAELHWPCIVWDDGRGRDGWVELSFRLWLFSLFLILRQRPLVQNK